MPAATNFASTSSFLTSSCLSKVRQDLKKSVHQFRVKHFKRQISGNSNSTTDAVALGRWRERHSSGEYEFDQETYIINSLNLDFGGVIAERTRRKTLDTMLTADSANDGQSSARKRKIALDDDAVLLEGQRKRSRFMGYCLRARTIE